MAAKGSGVRLRAEAAKILNAVVSDGRSLDWALADSDDRITPADRPIIRMLCYGCLRFHFRLRWQLTQLLDKPLKARDSIIESLLIVGFFQLSDTRVPDHAAVSTTVEAARLLRRPKYAGLVNAIMRNYLRKKINDKEPGDDEARFNHPAWLIERFKTDWPDNWRQIIDANNDRAPMWLRVNSQHASAADYLARNSVDGTLLDGAASALRLDKPLPIEEIPGFAVGYASVQDGAAQLAAPWLLAKGGGRVLDACAAPGGKTGHLLELLGPEDDLTAIDSDSVRLERVRQNLHRLGQTATLLAADASNTGEWWDGERFDRILLDAPCSASGVIRRHPDIKLLRRETDISALASLQSEMLEALWALLKPSGRLLYVTCSVLTEENDAVISQFLARHDDAQEDRVLHDYNIRDLMYERTSGFQVLPGTQGLDGFYFACLEKMSQERK
jgi:16S rRNA (cytosine967-C5)-methyltransferase